MKKIKIVATVFSLALFVLASCSDDKKDPEIPKPKPETPDVVTPQKEQTLADKLVGTYEAVMLKVEKKGEIKGKNLKLYFFVTPTVTKAKDSVSLEVRNWSGDFMPHLLSFKGIVKVEKSEKGELIMKHGDGGIPYSVAGLDSTDKEGTVEGSFVIDAEKKASFSTVFNVFGYTMDIKSTKLKSKKILPNQNSSLL